MVPPPSPARKSSGESCSNDGQELGLVPRYLLKKKSKDISSSPRSSGEYDPATTTPANGNPNTPTIKDLEVTYYIKDKSPEETLKLLQETDDLLLVANR
jgi:hypothetical protein